MISISEINDIQRLNRFRLLWKDLYGKTRRASFFQSLDWLESYWNHYAEGKKLRVLIVSVGSKPVGIVPLVVKPVKTPLGRLRVLSYPLDGWGMFYGPLGPYPAATLAAAMRYLQESPRDWDTIDLRCIDADGTDRGRTPNAMRCRGFRSYKQVSHSAGYVEMRSDWLDYWLERPESIRRRFQSAEESLAAMGDVRYLRYRPAGFVCDDADPFWSFYSAFDEMHCHSEKPVPCRTEIDFLRESYVKAVWAGAADLNLLYVNDKPVAGALNFHRNGLVENVRFVAAREFSIATTALAGRMLQNSFERKDGSFLFCPRDSQLAAGWKTAVKQSYQYTHFARIAPKAQMLRLRHCVGKWFSETGSSEVSPQTSEKHFHEEHQVRRPYAIVG